MTDFDSFFSILQLIDRKSFDDLVIKHGMDKGVRTFFTWEFTCALLACMALRLGSFRDVETTLGIPKSTLSDALMLRFHGFFQDLCDLILQGIRGRTENRKIRRALREIMAIDSSEIRVRGSIFSLPGWQQKQSDAHSAACELHVVYNVDGGWIDDFKVTGVRKHDSPVSMELALQPGKIYTFDRAYNDVEFWLKIIDAKSHFVTRLKECEKIRKLQAKVLKENVGKTGVLYEGYYVPSQPQMNLHRDKLELTQIRHIIYKDPETNKVFHFVTSDLKLSPYTIAAIYKRRWGVELLFRWLKGHLDIRYLAVKNSNSVKIQLAVVVLLQLLLQLKKLLIEFKGTLWDLLRQMRAHQTQQTFGGCDIPDGCRWKRPTTAEIEGVMG